MSKFKTANIFLVLSLGAIVFFLLNCNNGGNESSEPVTPQPTPLPSKITLTVTVIPANSCIVTPAQGDYYSGQVVSLSALPLSGFQFDYWVNTNNDHINPTTVTMNSNKNVEAHCSPIITRVTLTTTVTPANSCLVTPAQGTYNQGEVVTLNIQPLSGFQFDRAINTDNNYANPTTVTMNSDKEVQIFCIPTVNYALFGINLGPCVENTPCSHISETVLRQKMESVKNHAQWLKTYSVTSGLEKAGILAHQMGKKLAAGAYISANVTQNQLEITNLIAMGQNGEIDMAVVGNEYVLFNNTEAAVNQVIAYLRQVRQALPSNIPVTYADTYNILAQHPEIVAECDLVLVNIYPYWEGIDIKYAVYHTRNIYYQMSNQFAKQVILGEVGWPSAGNIINKAIPSPANAAYYFKNFVSWARAENIPYFYFEAYDEPWKIIPAAPQEGYFGIWTSDGILKDGRQEVFDGQTMADNWSGTVIINGPGTPDIYFTVVPPLGSTTILLEGMVSHIAPASYKVAVYIRTYWGWYNKPYWEEPATLIYPDGWWSCNIVTGSGDETAPEIRAYLVPANYPIPLLAGNPIPQDLIDNAVAVASVSR